MLRLPPFRLLRPGTLDDAVSMLRDAGDGARLLAGGTDLLPNLKRRHQKASTLIHLGGIAGLTGVHNGERPLTIGAMTTLSAVAGDHRVRERYPALARAVASISAPVLRNMGTLGGNLCLDTRCTYYNQNEEWRQAIHYCMKAEGETCWVAPGSPRCWAISASDSAPMLCALGATVHLVSADGERTLPVAELFRDDGMAYLTKRPDEILTEIELPSSSDATHCKSAFWKLRRRGAIDFAVLSVGAAVWLDEEGLVRDARIYLGAVGSAPIAATATAYALRGQALDAESISAAAALARKETTPMDNTDFLPAWRGTMVGKYVEAALRDCAGLPQERLSAKHH